MEIREFIEKFAETIEVESIEELAPETEFRELSEWSSISVMLTIAFFDEEFDKEINGSDFKKCKTILDLYNLAIDRRVL